MTAKQIRDLEQERNGYKQLYEQSVQDRTEDRAEHYKIIYKLVEAINSAITMGDWIVDGRCDPDMVLAIAKRFLQTDRHDSKRERQNDNRN